MGGLSVCQISPVQKSMLNFPPVFWKRWFKIVNPSTVVVEFFLFAFVFLNAVLANAVLAVSPSHEVKLCQEVLSEQSNLEHLRNLCKEK